MYDLFIYINRHFDLVRSSFIHTNTGVALVRRSDGRDVPLCWCRYEQQSLVMSAEVYTRHTGPLLWRPLGASGDLAGRGAGGGWNPRPAVSHRAALRLPAETRTAGRRGLRGLQPDVPAVPVSSRVSFCILTDAWCSPKRHVAGSFAARLCIIRRPAPVTVLASSVADVSWPCLLVLVASCRFSARFGDRLSVFAAGDSSAPSRRRG